MVRVSTAHRQHEAAGFQGGEMLALRNKVANLELQMQRSRSYGMELVVMNQKLAEQAGELREELHRAAADAQKMRKAVADSDLLTDRLRAENATLVEDLHELRATVLDLRGKLAAACLVCRAAEGEVPGKALTLQPRAGHLPTSQLATEPPSAQASARCVIAKGMAEVPAEQDAMALALGCRSSGVACSSSSATSSLSVLYVQETQQTDMLEDELLKQIQRSLSLKAHAEFTQLLQMFRSKRTSREETLEAVWRLFGVQHRHLYQHLVRTLGSASEARAVPPSRPATARSSRESCLLACGSPHRAVVASWRLPKSAAVW
eukprot:TRINITY_DN101518_c0_g1_i1.p1 TRINITY_DN101518_c0_g1~~TRINITY_DN101518_c0_g1_i1.p1  ORF type:complete len:319 (-),score=50.72 TRINITY_DN101518_c0_g1_i1:201-1157(-)